MKYIGDPQLAARLPEIFGLLSVFGEQRTVLGYLETLLRYLAAAVTVSEADVRHALVEVFPTLEERIMPTMVETWLERGRPEGLAKGRRMRRRRRRINRVTRTMRFVPQRILCGLSCHRKLVLNDSNYETREERG